MNVTMKKETYKFDKTQELFKKAAKVIPCGIYGHFSPAPLIPTTDYPFYTDRAKGARFWDVDGNEYIDYMCAYGPMIHGYCNETIDKAAKAEIDKGSCITGAPEVMVELAEYLVDMTEGMDWAFFAKNGADMTNFAVMAARSITSRKKIVIFGGSYHGTSPWMQGAGHHGVMADDLSNIINIKWNDFDAFAKVVAENHKDIAGLITTPYLVPTFYDSELPAPGYWEKVDALCKKEGIMLISDDIRHGFRIDIRGSHAHYGYKPDMVCYCKAIANGYPISALLGTEEIMAEVAKIFYTGSYWFTAEPMAAALATLKLHKEIDTPTVVKPLGEKLVNGLDDIAKGYGYELSISGDPTMPNIQIVNDKSLMLHQDWCAECTKRGVYLTSHHNWFVSAAHTEEDIQQTLEIADEAFKVVKKKYGDRF